MFVGSTRVSKGGTGDAAMLSCLVCLVTSDGNTNTTHVV